ncbi:MAG: type III pantothenate kinase [Thiotrichales bacterium]
MKNLGLLDLGNSRYKWTTLAALEADRLEPQKRAYVTDSAAMELAANLSATPVERWVVASVKGADFDAALSRALAGCQVDFVRIPANPPLPLAYHEPRQFGIDRYLNLLGALQRYTPPLLVVDAGTAVTFDAVDTQGAHLGGCIFPGRNLLSASLKSGTRLVQPDPAAVSSLFARSTAAGVNGGIETGWYEACHGIVRQMAREIGTPTQVVWTGGDGSRLHDANDASSHIDSRLLFRGIRASLELHES